MSNAPGSDTGSAGFQPAFVSVPASPSQTAGKDAGAPGKGKAPPFLAASSTSSRSPAKPEWHSRGYLPHRDRSGLTQAVTFRLADSLPADALAVVESELRHVDPSLRDVERTRRLAALLDRGHGACHLAQPAIAALVENALLHFDGERYRLLAWCIMPNHVHVLVEPLAPHTLAEIVHAWKSYTATRVNTLLARTGPFWMREYHDRFVRDAAHLAATIRYIDENPVKAGLAKNPCDFPFGSARRFLLEGK